MYDTGMKVCLCMCTRVFSIIIVFDTGKMANPFAYMQTAQKVLPVWGVEIAMKIIHWFVLQVNKISSVVLYYAVILY